LVRRGPVDNAGTADPGQHEETDRVVRGAGIPRPDGEFGGAGATELKQCTLTNLYNARPAWLAHARAAIDRAVWAAYGWDDADPAATEEDAILARLLALNGERAGG